MEFSSHEVQALCKTLPCSPVEQKCSASARSVRDGLDRLDEVEGQAVLPVVLGQVLDHFAHQLGGRCNWHFHVLNFLGVLCETLNSASHFTGKPPRTFIRQIANVYKHNQADALTHETALPSMKQNYHEEKQGGKKKILLPGVRRGYSNVISVLVNRSFRKSAYFPNSLTYHSFEPSAECWRKPGEELHALLDLSMEQGVGQPLPSQDEQLGCQHFFVSHLQEGLKAEKCKGLKTI